jgi:hypothetical protein
MLKLLAPSLLTYDQIDQAVSEAVKGEYPIIILRRDDTQDANAPYSLYVGMKGTELKGGQLIEAETGA